MTDPLMFIGSQIRSGGDGPDAIGVFRFNDTDGSMLRLGSVGGIDNPTWLTVDAGRRRLYAASEMPEWSEGTVSAYEIDAASGSLRYLNKQSTRGNCTCHLGISADGKYLAAANYAAQPEVDGPDQAVAFYRLGDAELAPASGGARHPGHSVLPDRQARSHGHCCYFTPDGKRLFVADLGLDRLVAYDIGAAGELTPAPRFDAVFEPGRGPRHIASHPDGRTLFVVHELKPGISVASLEADGTPVLSTVDFVYPTQVYPSAVQVSADGRFVYAMVRVTGDVIALEVGADRSVREIGRWPCGATWPRDARLSPSGKFLLVANQDGNKLTVFKRDVANGQLGDVATELELPTPMCIAFLGVEG